ncbi:hypothetical protein JW960_29575 [candidate division KSB1 bacterium]|nr:hypothetical protein [candidate division KSB1 bacterium]
MQNRHKINQVVLLALIMIMAAGSIHMSIAQEQRWIRIGESQCYFRDDGAETESDLNYLAWPALYGDNQHTTRNKAIWFGATNFFDPVEGILKSVKVVGAGPRYPENQPNMIFPQSIKLIGKFPHPTVIVDQQIGTNNTLYDVLDEVDYDLPCDRMVLVKYNSSMGVSVTRKIMAFTQENHDDYFIHELTIKNTGIYNKAGDVYEQTLENFWVYNSWRYAFAGVTSTGWGSTWGAFDSEWGASTLYRDFRPATGSDIRGFISWYGPNPGRPVPYADDWGCPNDQEDGLLGSAKYNGIVILHASTTATNWADDLTQPRTTAYIGADGTPVETAVSQFNELFMQQRYNIMTEGHLNETFEDAVGDDYVDNFATTATYRDNGTKGSGAQGQGFGPYTMNPGDSIRIVYAEGVNGISWPKAREVGAKWFAYYTGSGTPTLDLPGGGTASTRGEYTRAWCETGEDSIMQVLHSALANYNSNFAIPQAPPAPENFTVASGGDRIRLTWSDNARSHDHFNGYVIYRSEGSVKDYKTVYTKIFECDASYADNMFDDMTARRGFDYYYYIQAKDDGTQNDVHPGKPLYSSKFLTLTTVAARLRRPSGVALEKIRVVPNPFNISARKVQFGEDFQYDRLAFYGLPPYCDIKIYTERGDLIWSKTHDDGSGDELWDSQTSSGQIVVSGIYIAYFEVTQDVSDETTGEKMFSKGENIIRKFVVIR